MIGYFSLKLSFLKTSKYLYLDRTPQRDPDSNLPIKMPKPEVLYYSNYENIRRKTLRE